MKPWRRISVLFRGRTEASPSVTKERYRFSTLTILHALAVKRSLGTSGSRKGLCAARVHLSLRSSVGRRVMEWIPRIPPAVKRSRSQSSVSTWSKFTRFLRLRQALTCCLWSEPTTAGWGRWSAEKRPRFTYCCRMKNRNKEQEVGGKKERKEGRKKERKKEKRKD